VLVIRVMSLVGRGGILLTSKTEILKFLTYIYTSNLVGRYRLSHL
jgi:hypothetical protein